MSTEGRSPTRLDPGPRVERPDGLTVELPAHPPALTPLAARLLLELLALDPVDEGGPDDVHHPAAA